MLTKSFILKIQSPTSTTSSKDYILVLNTRFTTTQFISDLQELYPPTTDAKLLVLKVQGTYRMMPRQFLRHMWANVDYKPSVRHGVYVPSMFGRDNMVKIVYEEEKDIPVVESMPIAAPAPVAPKTVAVTQKPADSDHGVVKVEKAIALPSNSNQPLSAQITPQPQGCRPNESFNALRPTHTDAPHEIEVFFYGGEDSPLKKYDLGSITVPVSVSGGEIECLQLLPQIKSGLKKWLDPSTVELGLTMDYEAAPRGTHIEWDETSFEWMDYGSPMGKWVFGANAYIYENQ
ncbi:hypothetical protein EV426DRAFT_576841 [Tirmania nivea]|nr:hypothetical protein EV426DRAFT_576841 [Tirmania nivea]